MSSGHSHQTEINKVSSGQFKILIKFQDTWTVTPGQCYYNFTTGNLWITVCNTQGGSLTNSDSIAVQFWKRFLRFASVSVRTCCPGFVCAAAGTSTVSCRCQMFVRSTPAIVCARIAANPCIQNDDLVQESFFFPFWQPVTRLFWQVSGWFFWQIVAKSMFYKMSNNTFVRKMSTNRVIERKYPSCTGRLKFLLWQPITRLFWEVSNKKYMSRDRLVK